MGSEKDNEGDARGPALSDGGIYRLIFDSMPDPIILLDAGCRIEALNHEASLMLPSEETYNSPTIPWLSTELSTFMSSGLSEQTLEKEVKTKAGIRLFLVAIKKLPDLAGRPSSPIVILRDITDERLQVVKMRQEADTLQEKARQKTDDLIDAKLIAESANRAKSVFLSNMSHELRTPLNVIIGYSEALVSGVYGEISSEHKTHINEILKGGLKLLDLIDRILDIAKMDAGSMQLDLHPCSLKDVMNSVAYLFQEKATKHGIALRVDARDIKGPILVDEQKIRQVLMHLVSNAFRFTPDGGLISITARILDAGRLMAAYGKVEDHFLRGLKDAGQTTSDFVEIAVLDTGLGVSEKDRQTLFEPFYQTGTALSDKKEGAGLGLALCRRYAELHKGSIWVESPPSAVSDEDISAHKWTGHGSRFVLVLPIEHIHDIL